MWHRNNIATIVAEEPDYVTAEDTYHRLRKKRVGWMRRFYNFRRIPVLTSLRRRVSMWNIRNELGKHIRRGRLIPYNQSVFFKR
jgi:hypothetical protein